MKHLILAFLCLVTSVCFAQEHFTTVEPHELDGNLCQILEAEFDGNSLVAGDEIGVFDSNNFDPELCVGAGIVNGAWPVNIETYPYQVGVPGYFYNHPIYFKVWKHELDREYICDATYISGTGVYDTETDIHMANLTSRSTFCRQWVMQGDLWDQVQIRMVPEVNEISAIFNTMEHFICVLAPNGNQYIPGIMDLIGEIDPYSYYYVSHSAGDILTIWGTPLWEDPADVLIAENYFELVSSYMLPFDVNAEDIFGGVESLMVVYQNDGGIYVPDFDPPVNTIGNVDFCQAYRLFCSENSEWQIQGDLLDPETEFSLNENIWNWVGYPFDHSVSAEIALNQIEDNLVIAQSDDGRILVPNLGINTMGDMQPCEGYMIFVDEDLTFTYEDNDQFGKQLSTEVWDIPKVAGAPGVTGLPYTVIVRLTEKMLACNPAYIEIYDGDLLVGKSVVLADYPCTPVTAWGGSKEHNLAGFETGNAMIIKIKAIDGSEIHTISNENNLRFGKGAYAEITLDSEISEIPSEFAVSSAYPNPFNPSTCVKITLPESSEVSISLFNILGQQVYFTSAEYSAGQHIVNIDANSIKNEIVSGVYFLNVNIRELLRVRKSCW